MLASQQAAAAGGMQGVLQAVEAAVTSGLMQGFVDVGISLGAACASMSMISVFRSYLQRDGSFDLMEFVRPILMFLLVMNFNLLVLSPIRTVTALFTTPIVEMTGTSTEEFRQLYRQSVERLSERDADDDGDTMSSDGDGQGWFARTIGKVSEKVVKSVFDIGDRIRLGAGELFSGLMFYLLNIALSVMTIIAHMFILLMSLLGPVTFAIGIIPQFSSGVILWIERFVQFSLWEPILYLVTYIGMQILLLGNASHDWGGFWTWLFMSIAILTMIRLVPTMASYIIEGPGDGGAGGEMSGSLGGVIRKAAAFVRMGR